MQPGGESAGVSAKRIHMVDLPPEPRIGGQIVAHFGILQIEGQHSRLTGHIGVVNSCAIEPGEFLAFTRNQRRNPVENDADLVLVAGVNKCHESFGLTIARVGRVVAGDGFTLSPERQFDVVTAVFPQVRQHAIAELLITGNPFHAAVGVLVEDDPMQLERQ